MSQTNPTPDDIAAQRQLALEIARLGTWEFDPELGQVCGDARCHELFLLPDAPFHAVDRIATLVHPDDRERVQREVAGVLDPRGPGTCDTECRVLRGDGSTCWVVVRGRAVPGDHGGVSRPRRVIGTVMDATARRSAEAAAHANAERARTSEHALREANARLEEADRRGAEFVAMISHELRNPLAPIRYALPLLKRGLVGPTTTRAAAVIDRQVDRLTRLVDDLLDVSRVTGREIELQREPVTLDRIVSDACESAGPTIAAARHVLRVDVPEAPIWLHADPARLTRVLGSLLDNSAKYTPRGGEIVVEARVEGGTAVVGVRDTGIGIPAEALPTVFDVLHEAAHTARSPRGLHIGLALVKQFVELHGGTIAARSDGEGLGAAFEIRLPVAPDGRRPAKTMAPEQAPAAAKRLKVLVVDDNADLVDVLAAMVTALGHDARKALDGRTAVSAARHYRPDVVLLDLGLPVMGGIEVARELRRLPDTAGARLVALTGWGQAEDRRQTREAGFDDHLVKPTNPGALERLLAEAAQAASGSRLPASGFRP